MAYGEKKEAYHNFEKLCDGTDNPLSDEDIESLKYIFTKSTEHNMDFIQNSVERDIQFVPRPVAEARAIGQLITGAMQLSELAPRLYNTILQMQRDKLNIICLCGSTRFKKAYQEWNARLTLEGYLVFSVAMWSHSTKIEPTEEQKRLLDTIHLKKIDASSEIFVLDVDGYIGESTKKEIDYAKWAGKEIKYLSEEYPDWTENDCIYTKE